MFDFSNLRPTSILEPNYDSKDNEQSHKYKHVSHINFQLKPLPFWQEITWFKQ